MSNTPRTVDTKKLLADLRNAAGETFFAYRDEIIAGVEELGRELAAAKQNEAVLDRRIAHLNAAVIESQKDAERYWWLRNVTEDAISKILPHLAEEQRDAAIDAAMKEPVNAKVSG